MCAAAALVVDTAPERGDGVVAGGGDAGRVDRRQVVRSTPANRPSIVVLVETEHVMDRGDEKILTTDERRFAGENGRASRDTRLLPRCCTALHINA